MHLGFSEVMPGYSFTGIWLKAKGVDNKTLMGQ